MRLYRGEESWGLGYSAACAWTAPERCWNPAVVLAWWGSYRLAVVYPQLFPSEAQKLLGLRGIVYELRLLTGFYHRTLV
jgi:hypothetical protein